MPHNFKTIEVITIGHNPWVCEEEKKNNATPTLSTNAILLGCPCYTRPTCGQAHLATPERELHFATYTEPAVRTDIINIEHDGTPLL